MPITNPLGKETRWCKYCQRELDVEECDNLYICPLCGKMTMQMHPDVSWSELHDFNV